MTEAIERQTKETLGSNEDLHVDEGAHSLVIGQYRCTRF